MVELVHSRIKISLFFIGLIVLLGLLIYINTLGHGFVFDDHSLIEERSIIQNPSWISVKNVVLNNYRPVRDLALMFISATMGPYPVSFHLTNVFLHLLNGVMVFILTLQLTQSIRIAIFTAVLFTTHPIQTDTVSYASGIRDTLSSFFVLTALYIYMIYHHKPKSLLYLLFCVLLFLGLATKEMAIVLVLLVFLYDLQVQINDRNGESLLGYLRRTLPIVKRKAWSYLLVGAMVLFGVVFYLIVHHSSARIQESGIHWWGGSVLMNYLTVPILWITYLKKLIFPHPLIADYMGFPIVPLTPADPLIWISIGFIGFLIFLSLTWLRDRPVWGFALGWVLVTLIPVVQITS
jgi:protein O-mannosyl-transferase